jgi:hypothetical protein
MNYSIVEIWIKTFDPESAPDPAPLLAHSDEE